MSENVGDFQWTTAREQAAAAVARDEETNLQIATRLGITERTLERWKLHPSFRARVEEHVSAFRLAVRAHGIAIIENRVAALQDRWERMRRVIEERGKEHDGEEPGSGTGLLARQEKMIGAGPLAQQVTEWTFDAALVKELREHEKQAAQELNQWAEVHQVGGIGGGPVVLAAKDLDDCSDTELGRQLAEAGEFVASVGLPPAPRTLRPATVGGEVVE